MTELLVTEATLADADAERSFTRAAESPALPPGCLRAERARTARPRTYLVLTWWSDAGARKAYEATGALWPGAEAPAVARLERGVFEAQAAPVVRAACAECGEVVPVTIRPAGDTCAQCGASLPGRPASRALPAPLAPLPVGKPSDLDGVDLEPGAARAVAAYFDAWNTDDAAERKRLLESGLAETATYQDPSTPAPVDGRAAIETLIREMRRRFDGIAFELAHAYGRGRLVTAEWRMVLPTPEGPAVTPGVDVLELAPDGRLARIIAYYDRAPAVWRLANRAFA